MGEILLRKRILLPTGDVTPIGVARLLGLTMRQGNLPRMEQGDDEGGPYVRFEFPGIATLSDQQKALLNRLAAEMDWGQVVEAP